MKSVKKEVSFKRKLMTAVLSVTLPLIALLLFSNLYSTQAFNQKIADSNMRTMDYRARRIEEQLDSVNDFLTGLTVSDDYRTLSGGEKNPLKAYLASYTLITQLKTALPAYRAMRSAIFLTILSRTSARRCCGRSCVRR